MGCSCCIRCLERQVAMRGLRDTVAVLGTKGIEKKIGYFMLLSNKALCGVCS